MAAASGRFPDQTGKVAVVTGANSGLGWETARSLSEAGARVVLACRDRERGQRALERILEAGSGAQAELLLVDLADLGSVATFAETYQERFDRLDILVNNAGVMFPPRTLTRDGFELQFGVNHLGHFALDARLSPLLMRTPGSRVVTVTSAMHWLGRLKLDDVRAERGYNRFLSYTRSKLCNLLFAFELDRRLRANRSSTMSLAAHPGLSRSHLSAYSTLTHLATQAFGQSAVAGARPVLHAATHPAVHSGDFFGPWLIAWAGARRAMPSPAASNPDLGARLWRASEELTGLSFALGESAEA